MYGESYIGNNEWRFIKGLKCMETHMEGTIKEIHLDCTMYILI